MKIKGNWAGNLKELLNSLSVNGMNNLLRVNIVLQLEEFENKLQKELFNLAISHAQTDEKGNIIADEQGNLQFGSEEELKTFQEKQLDVFNKEMELEINSHEVEMLLKLMLDESLAIDGRLSKTHYIFTQQLLEVKENG